MGKSSRKKKEKKKDFQKVKLKVGKTKPKADNFTDTTFKSKAILVRDQLKSAHKGDEPITQRKQNIQDLLCQVHHYNTSVRTSAIQGIKSLLTSHPSLVHDHLSTLITIFSAVMADKEGAVRRAGSDVLRIVMDAQPTNQMSPFFSVVCMHLCCAMTHIDEDIQLDSLVVMETILHYYPGLVVPHSKELLTNFIHLLSQQRRKLGSASSLKVNPSGKLAGQKWRVKVLQMLWKLLQVVKEAKITSSSNSSDVGHFSTPPSVNVEPGKPTHIPIMKSFWIQSQKQKPFVLRTDQSSSDDKDFLSNPPAILDVSRTLVPLLLQCWGEANLPSQGQSKGKGCATLGVQEGESLRTILAALQTLWDLLEMVCEERGDWSTLGELRKSVQRKMEQHFLQGFPYSLHLRAASHSKKGKAKSAGGPSPSRAAIAINLAASNLVLSILATGGARPRLWFRTVGRFVEGVLREDGGGEENMKKEEQHVLMSIVGRLCEAADDDGKTNLMSALYGYYLEAHPLSQQKLVAMRVFRELCLDATKSSERHGSEKLTEFLESLVLLVFDSRNGSLGVSREALHTLSVAAAQGCAEAVTCFQENLSSWLDGEDAVISFLDEPAQQRLIQCLFHLPHYDSKLVACLTRYCCRPDIDIKVPLYLLVNRCFENVLGTSNPPLSDSSLIDLVFTSSMGQSHEDLTVLQDQMNSDENCMSPLGNASGVGSLRSQYHLLQGTADAADLHRCTTVNKVVAAVYRRFPDKKLVVAEVLSRISKMMTACHYLPIRTVCSIFHHFTVVMETNASPASSLKIPEAVARFVGELAFLSLCQTVLDRKCDLERGQETVGTLMWQLAVDCVVACGDSTVDTVLQLANETCKGCWSKEAVAAVTSLIQIDSVKGSLRRHGPKLQSLVRCLEEQPVSLQDSRGFAELNYEVGLLLKGLQMDR